MTYRNGDYSLIQLLPNLISIMAFIWNLNLLFSQKSLYNLALKSILNMRAHCNRQAYDKTARINITYTDIENSTSECKHAIHTERRTTKSHTRNYT